MEWPKDMLEEIEDFRLERSIRSLKTNEEIEKLSVDEKLSSLDRALYLLKNGQDVQKLSVVSNLTSLMRQSPSETQRKVLPKICELVPSAHVDIQVGAAEAFSLLLENKQLTAHTFHSMLFPTVLNGLESRERVVSSAWVKTLLVVVSSYSSDVIRREILPIALAKGQLSQTVLSRLASCEILGQIATKFEAVRVCRELLSLVTSLCQDVDYEVRACMCRQLAPIAKQLGSELTGNLILPELIELAKDEECTVRIACLETLVSILDQLDKELRVSSVIPLVRECFESAFASKDASLQVVCQLYGRFCHVLKDVCDNDHRKWFLNFYCQMATLNQGNAKSQMLVTAPKTMGMPSSDCSISDNPISECRRLCAYNFPAMTLFAEPHNFEHELSVTLQRLVTDQHPKVRRTVASGFHEVAKILGPILVGVVRPQFLTLLKESSVEVLQGVVSHLGDSLCVFANHASLGDSKFGGLPDFIPAIITCSQTVAKSRLWRLQEDLLRQYCSLPNCLTSDQIYYKFVPRAFKLLSSKHVLPVKLAAGRALCIFICHNRRKEQRQDMCSRIIEDLGGSRSYWNRLLFIDVCGFILEFFSKRFFKTTFFEFVLVLAKDPVANVRLRLCRFLPKLKSVLKLPTDRALLQQFQLVTRHLLTTEKDTDVEAGIRTAFKELDRMDITVETLSGRTFFEDDLLDAKKEEDEKQIEMEEELEAAEQEKNDKESTKHGRHSIDSKKGRSAKKTSGGGKVSRSTSQTSPASVGRSLGGTAVKPSATQASSSGSKSSQSSSSKAVTTTKTANDRIAVNSEQSADQRIGKKPDLLPILSPSVAAASPRAGPKRFGTPQSPKPSASPVMSSALATKATDSTRSSGTRGTQSRSSAGVASRGSGSITTLRSGTSSPHIPLTTTKSKEKTSSHIPSSSPVPVALKGSFSKKNHSTTSNGQPHIALSSTKSVKPKT
ncbi:serine/threonine-protein phosphatase 4 regulatory subunit 4-like isoform X2 [Corticium candelabrum]|uniref:serine/threonine-protein phosphatase 4 regulatory subunit 4-like isoform X2 n=1 Tax=Corticium candelabrum TaxID=121492 RepID=UPI002E276316|nr:serine/threonine-protein phosphatase 4 regulatory subunit 4-like isoform X2 [Corticium candelabrum]